MARAVAIEIDGVVPAFGHSHPTFGAAFVFTISYLSYQLSTGRHGRRGAGGEYAARYLIARCHIAATRRRSAAASAIAVARSR